LDARRPDLRRWGGGRDCGYYDIGGYRRYGYHRFGLVKPVQSRWGRAGRGLSGTRSRRGPLPCAHLKLADSAASSSGPTSCAALQWREGGQGGRACRAPDLLIFGSADLLTGKSNCSFWNARSASASGGCSLAAPPRSSCSSAAIISLVNWSRCGSAGGCGGLLIPAIGPGHWHPGAAGALILTLLKFVRQSAVQDAGCRDAALRTGAKAVATHGGPMSV
jgi:hypothetical protein